MIRRSRIVRKSQLSTSTRLPSASAPVNATHQPPTDPTTQSAQNQTTAPCNTSIETSLVQRAATTPRNHRRYGRVDDAENRVWLCVWGREPSSSFAVRLEAGLAIRVVVWVMGQRVERSRFRCRG
jgi:hypothetical protein